MRITSWTAPVSAMVLGGVLCLAVGSLVDPSRVSSGEKKSDSSARTNEKRVSVQLARSRAKLAHSIYAATLDVIHHHYFRDARSSVPSRALEDVFPKIARQENIQAKWIAVNARAMSIDHQPKSDFEKRAAKAIAAGKPEFELVERGIYRRAAGISLMEKGCLGCHVGFGASGKKKRFAGLIIAIPVTEK